MAKIRTPPTRAKWSRPLACLCLGLFLYASAAAAPGDVPLPPTMPDQTATANSVRLPAGWRGSFVQEPILNSTIYVVIVGDKQKPPLVLLHGLGQAGLMDWQAVIESLKNRYYIIAFDFPGFGRSSLPTGRLSPENYAALTHWLIQTHELKRFHLAGHSMGGAVALLYAATYPETLNRLTLIDVAGVLHRAAFVKSAIDLDQFDYQILPDGLQETASRILNFGDRLVETIGSWPDVTEPFREIDLTWNYLLNGRPNANAALSLIHTDYSRILDAVTTPTAIIWGELDPIAPLRTGYVLDGLIADSELHVIPGAKHVPLKTHTASVVNLLQEPVSPARDSAASATKGDLNCQGETGQRYSGRYRHITLDHCLDMELFDIQADSIVLKNSTAEMTRIHVRSDTLALGLRDSVVRLTDAHLVAPVAVEMDGSRLDMAGAHLKAQKVALKILGESVVVASVSEVESPVWQGKLHGIAQVDKAVGEALDELQSDASGDLLDREP